MVVLLSLHQRPNQYPVWNPTLAAVPLPLADLTQLTLQIILQGLPQALTHYNLLRSQNHLPLLLFPHLLLNPVHLPDPENPSGFEHR